MKLKLLLPAATIASVATVVTPLVTSCGGIPTSWDFKKNPEYTAKIKALEGKKMTDQEATQAYYDKLSKTPALYRDDWFAYFSEYLASGEITIRKATMKTNISGVKLVQRVAPGDIEKSKMISATFECKFDLDASSSNEGKNESMSYSYTFTLKNFKMWVNWVGFAENNSFIFRHVISNADPDQMIQFLINDKEWSFTSSGKLNGTDATFDKVSASNVKSLPQAKLGMIRQMISPLAISSHYLSECTQNEEPK